jgi:hypothetical protein
MGKSSGAPRITSATRAASPYRHGGDASNAERLYADAAAEAERAMALVPPERKVTFGVVAMLAHRLWRRARRLDVARTPCFLRTTGLHHSARLLQRLGSSAISTRREVCDALPQFFGAGWCNAMEDSCV